MADTTHDGGAPPILLAIESATRRASVALVQGDVLLGALASGPGQQHAEQLMPMLDALLVETGVGLDDLDAFAISIGPGAFTSLRIGLSTLKGLAFGAPKPVVALSTLEVLGRSAQASGAWRPEEGALVPALDARRGEVYACAYPAEAFADIAFPTPSLADGVYTPEALVAAVPGRALVVGEGAGVVADALEGLAPGLLRWQSGPPVDPDATALARAALPRLAAGEGVDARTLVPRYVRRAEAEVTLRGKRFE